MPWYGRRYRYQSVQLATFQKPFSRQLQHRLGTGKGRDVCRSASSPRFFLICYLYVLTMYRTPIASSWPSCRRSCAPSPDSLTVGEKTACRSPIPQVGHAEQVTQKDAGTLATPEASSSYNQPTKPAVAGSLDSYLTCSQPHEQLALCLLHDEEGQEQDGGSQGRDSVVLGKRKFSGVYEPPEGSPSPPIAAAELEGSRIEHSMERCVASADPHENLAYQMQETYPQTDQEEYNQGPSQDLESGQPSRAAVHPSDPSISLTGSLRTDNIDPGPVEGPIEVGFDRNNSDSAISDMEADELHQHL